MGKCGAKLLILKYLIIARARIYAANREISGKQRKLQYCWLLRELRPDSYRDSGFFPEWRVNKLI